MHGQQNIKISDVKCHSETNEFWYIGESGWIYYRHTLRYTAL